MIKELYNFWASCVIIPILFIGDLGWKLGILSSDRPHKYEYHGKPEFGKKRYKKHNIRTVTKVKSQMKFTSPN